MSDLSIILGFEATSDLEETQALIRTDASSHKVISYRHSAEKTGQCASSPPRAVITPDNNAVKRLAKLAHVLGLDLDPVVVSAVQLVRRAWVFEDQPFRGLGHDVAKHRLDGVRRS